jgi:hypothetical protein
MNTPFSFLRPLSVSALAALFSLSQASAAFIAPTDLAPFRRDQLPITADVMKQLADDLTILCSSLSMEQPDEQRHAAQFVAVCLAIDPGNHHAENLLEKYQEGEIPHGPGSTILTDTKTRVWSTQSWLASDEAGKDGNALGLCLGDALAKLDSQHPSAASFSKERGNWNNWVAPIEQFTLNNSEESPPQVEENPAEESPSQPETPSDREASFRLTEAVLSSPLWTFVDGETRVYSFGIVPVKLKTWQDQDYDQFRYHLDNIDQDRIRPTLKSINSATVPRLEQMYGYLPKGGVVNLTLPDKTIYSVRFSGESLGAVAGVLAANSLSGEAPTGIVVGVIDSEGKLKMPPNAWEIIRALSAAPRSRIVLPADSAELLTALMLMDDLAFFMKHDVFLASNYEELIAFSKQKPDAKIADVLTQFAAIREKSTSSIGPFVSYPTVRARLETIVKAMPQYASASYLLLQASGRRPSQLTTKALAHQIRAAIVPLQQIVEYYENDDDRKATSAVIQAAHDSSRAALDPLDRFVTSADRPLYTEALALSNTARTLARAVKKIADKGDDEVERFHDKSYNESRRTLRNGIPTFERSIARTLGEPVKD